MIPILQEPSVSHHPDVESFIQNLNLLSFEGDIQTDYKTRLITATDNSVYQVLPAAVLYPKNAEDVQKIVTAGLQYTNLTFTPRGGGTGTNGQSLNNGVCIDLSKYMNSILEVNAEERWVKVQPGVVLDQLNAHVKPTGTFFAPTLSTSSRATLGGMISTDACGKGSRVYGKTSDHILELTILLVDGTQWTTKKLNLQNLNSILEKNGRISEIHKAIDEIVTSHKEKIEDTFPKLSRFMTGYNLAKIKTEEHFNLNYLISGSEGTLAFILDAKLKLTDLPKNKHLFALMYENFDHALEDAQVLVEQDPTAIETIDDKIITLAKDDAIWHKVGHIFQDDRVKAVNLIEFSGTKIEEYQSKLDSLVHSVESKNSLAFHYFLTSDNNDIVSLWELRKKGVGLLGNAKGNRRPIPFVEDTAVPPENLAAYIKEFKTLLDKHGLKYGMFGHVDVGCLHVRPALDIRNEDDEKLFKTISDEVVKLVKKYKGVMWAEHGKGFRSEYCSDFFGKELYQEVKRIKEYFDPHNRLNPGKIATPLSSNHEVTKVNEASMRGQLDRTISNDLNQTFGPAHFCNGNGACYNYNPDDVMCPSYRVTRNRVRSPKGRAGLIREWSRRLSEKGINLNQIKTKDLSFKAILSSLKQLLKNKDNTSMDYDFSHEVYDAMQDCLACKACSSQCPIKVDIPEYRSTFLNYYHSRYSRPLKDYLVASIEHALPIQSKFPKLINKLVQFPKIVELTKANIGMIDTPQLSVPTLAERVPHHSILKQNSRLDHLRESDINHSVIIVQDAFTSFYDASILEQTFQFLTKLQIRVYFTPYLPNGKPWHVKGFLDQFRKTAKRQSEMIQSFKRFNLPMIGIEPSVTLTYKEEYPEHLQVETLEVNLIQDWLISYLSKNPPRKTFQYSKEIFLLSHCTEKTSQPGSVQNWVHIFSKFGLKLTTLQTGCCGMAGTFGHETQNLSASKELFEMSWSKHLDAHPEAVFLSTGFSCRSQVKRFHSMKLMHPMEFLNQLDKT